MKKKIVSTLLCTAMLVTMMAGCGGNNAANTSTNSGNSSSADTGSSDAAATDEAAQATEAAASDASASDEGKVLNIYCWNEEFKSRVTDHYPGYTEVDATTGTIGTSAQVGVHPSKEYCFLIFVTPVGPYFKQRARWHNPQAAADQNGDFK